MDGGEGDGKKKDGSIGESVEVILILFFFLCIASLCCVTFVFGFRRRRWSI